VPPPILKRFTTIFFRIPPSMLGTKLSEYCRPSSVLRSFRSQDVLSRSSRMSRIETCLSVTTVSFIGLIPSGRRCILSRFCMEVVSYRSLLFTQNRYKTPVCGEMRAFIPLARWMWGVCFPGRAAQQTNGADPTRAR
jgi:hypothetical protein